MYCLNDGSRIYINESLIYGENEKFFGKTRL